MIPTAWSDRYPSISAPDIAALQWLCHFKLSVAVSFNAAARLPQLFFFIPLVYCLFLDNKYLALLYLKSSMMDARTSNYPNVGRTARVVSGRPSLLQFRSAPTANLTQGRGRRPFACLSVCLSVAGSTSKSNQFVRCFSCHFYCCFSCYDDLFCGCSTYYACKLMVDRRTMRTI